MTRNTIFAVIRILLVLGMLYSFASCAGPLMGKTSIGTSTQGVSAHSVKESTTPSQSVASTTMSEFRTENIASAGSRQAGSQALTVTTYADRLYQLHLTSPAQIAAGYKGGEGWQMAFSMDIAPSDPKKLVMGVDTSGIWKSEDGGTNWRCSSEGFDTICAYALAFDPNNAEIIYALGGSSTVAVSYISPETSGLYRSSDGGKSWNRIYDTTMTRRFASKLIAFGQEAGTKTIFVGTQEDGLLKSIDGTRFSPLGALSGAGAIFDVNADGQFILAATEKKGIVMSADGGLTWKSRNEGIPATYSTEIKAISITVNPINREHWFCIAGNAVYQTANSGGSWTKLSSSDAMLGGYSMVTHQKILFSAPPKNGTAPHLYLHMNEIGYPLRVSNDYGATWNEPAFDKSIAYNSRNTGFYAEAFTVDNANSENMWICWNGEIFRTTNGGATFRPSSSGYSGANATNIVFDEENPDNVFVTALDFGISRSVSSSGPFPAFRYLTGSSGVSYDTAKSAHGLARDPNDSNHLFSSVGRWSTSCLMESVDGGESWRMAGGTQVINTDCDHMLLQYHKTDPNFIYAGKYFSQDNGKTWTAYSSGLSVQAVSPVDPDLVFSVTDQKTVSVSQDRGATWQRLSAPTAGFYTGARMVMPDLRDRSILWVARLGQTPVKLTIYLDNGAIQSYREYTTADGFVANSKGEVSIWTIAQNPQNPQHMIAGGADYIYQLPGPGFFESTDGGNTWHMIEGMGGPRDVRIIAFHPTLPQVWLGTSAGIWIYLYGN